MTEYVPTMQIVRVESLRKFHTGPKPALIRIYDAHRKPMIWHLGFGYKEWTCALTGEPIPVHAWSWRMWSPQITADLNLRISLAALPFAKIAPWLGDETGRK